MMTVTLTLELNDQDAWALAQLVKRLGWQALSDHAVNSDEAERMRNAIAGLQTALSQKGYSPR